MPIARGKEKLKNVASCLVSIPRRMHFLCPGNDHSTPGNILRQVKIVWINELVNQVLLKINY